MKGTINFTIRTLKDSRASIQLVHRFGRKNEVRYSTGRFIKSASYWNKNKQRVKLISAQPDASKINQYLDKLSVAVGEKLNELWFENQNYSREDVITVFDDISGKSTDSNNSNPSLIECYQWYIEYFSKNPNPTTQRPLSSGTVRSFRSSFKIFEEYCKINGPIGYGDISMQFYEDFLSYLRLSNYSNNYIANHIKNLKTILNYSFTRGYHSNITHKRREFAKPNESVDAIFLNLEELKSIENLDLPPGQDLSRDLFLMGAYTGLRVSDFNRLKKKNLKFIDDRYYIEIESKKTKKMLLIPCNPTTQRIIEKYNAAPPPMKLEQHINRDLKLIGEKAGLTDVVVIAKTVGGTLGKQSFKKYELISTHTARRSFCTNAYISGMPTLDIMTISGHQTERVFYNYIKASSLDKAKKIAEHPFFNS
jgi:site-specific recombinase XerD